MASGEKVTPLKRTSAAGTTTYAFNNMVVSDPMGNLLKLFTYLSVGVTLVYARQYTTDRGMLGGALGGARGTHHPNLLPCSGARHCWGSPARTARAPPLTLRAHGSRVVFLTGRPDYTREKTEKWLKANGLDDYDRLFAEFPKLYRSQRRMFSRLNR